MKIPVICQGLYPDNQTKMGLRPNVLSYFYVYVKSLSTGIIIKTHKKEDFASLR